MDAGKVINEIPVKIRDLELTISNYQNIIKDTTINEANSVKAEIRDLKLELSHMNKDTNNGLENKFKSELGNISGLMPLVYWCAFIFRKTKFSFHKYSNNINNHFFDGFYIMTVIFLL